MKMTLQQLAAMSQAQIKAMFAKPDPREPASEIDDESPRAKAIGQNGNTGIHYDTQGAL